ncbi:short-chain dehydrogenase [Variovorax boronicumulans]|uniref:short-chain dehydrogenase n=1 Tax=Variovorax boronicumulans TaxID=436515 RepID=UPI00339398FB
MPKRNTPIRMIIVRPAQPRKRMVLAWAQRFGIATGARHATQSTSTSPARECRLESLDLDQRVREVGEW